MYLFVWLQNVSDNKGKNKSNSARLCGQFGNKEFDAQ
jgi:hypothetical protein